ncbi:hypothetical protein AB9C63_22955, partial [Escherichia coli]
CWIIANPAQLVRVCNYKGKTMKNKADNKKRNFLTHSKINIKNSAKFNIRSTIRLTYDIIRQLHLPQNGYFMERSNFLVAIIRLILRSLAIIPGWFVSLVHEIVTFLFILEIWGKAGDDFFICIRW